MKQICRMASIVAFLCLAAGSASAFSRVPKCPDGRAITATCDKAVCGPYAGTPQEAACCRAHLVTGCAESLPADLCAGERSGRDAACARCATTASDPERPLANCHDAACLGAQKTLDACERQRAPKRGANEVGPRGGLGRALDALTFAFGLAIGEGQALAAERKRSSCWLAVARATACGSGDGCAPERAVVASTCKRADVQQWLVDNFMEHFHEDVLPMSVDGFMRWLKDEGSTRDCHNLVGEMGWASTMPYEFVGHPEVSVTWRNAAFELTERIKNGPCLGRGHK